MKLLVLLCVFGLLVNMSECSLSSKLKKKQSEDELMNTCDISLLIDSPAGKDNKSKQAQRMVKVHNNNNTDKIDVDTLDIDTMDLDTRRKRKLRK